MSTISSKTTNDSINSFFDSWRLYQKIIEHNYMQHQQMSRTLQTVLLKNSNKELSILDLGCGDAYAISKALDGIEVKRYIGIDLSENALDYARTNLSGLNGEHDFLVGDLLTESKKLKQTFDIIIAGYSVHHLQTKGKRQLFTQCKSLLNNDGQFLYYDEQCKSNESHDDYIFRLLNIASSEWQEISEKEYVLMQDHVVNNDYPESMVTINDIARAAGFKQIETLYGDSNDLFTFIRIQ